MKKKRKKSDKQRLKEQLWKLICRYIKLRDNNTCQMCRKTGQGSGFHVSHVIPKSHGNVLRFDENNLKVLCFHCHINIWHKNPIEAYKWFKKTFPERYEYLEDKKSQIVKLSIEDYNNMIDEYTDKTIGMVMKNEDA